MNRPVREVVAGDEDSGFTLIELLVSITLLSILMALVTSAMLSMFSTTRKQQGVADAADANRAVLQRLDRDVRFANAVNTPGAGATAGSWYVEWRNGNTGQPQTCTQWRFAAGALQSRSWTEGSASATLTSWSTLETGVTAVSGKPIFDLGSAVVTGSGAAPQRQQLLVAFQSTRGVQQRSVRATQLTITAANTASSTVAAGVCTDLNTISNPTAGRP